MTDVNYNEFTNSLSYSSSDTMDPMFRCCEHFPERLSRLHLSSELFSPLVRRQNRRSRDRYKTQPITFDEITEVDEENAAAVAAAKGLAQRNNRLSAGCVEPGDETVLEKFRLSNQHPGENPNKNAPEETSSPCDTTHPAEDTSSALGDDSPFVDGRETSPRSAGFAAALEHARRRRKYSKRCRRRNSDMQEESTSGAMWDEDRIEEVCSGGI